MQGTKRVKWWRGLERRLRPIRHFMIIATFESSHWIVGRLPHRLVLWVGALLGGLAARVPSSYRRMVMKQLAMAGVGADEAERRRICKGVFRELGMNALESLHAQRWTPERIRRQVLVEHQDPFDEAQAMGRGLVLITGHMGNWELLPPVHYAFRGEEMVVTMADAKDPLLTKWLIKRRETSSHCRLVLTSEGLAMMRALLKKKTLSLLVDQDSTRTRGIFVEFFGRPAYTPAGPAQMARRIGAPILMVGIVRDPERPTYHHILIDKLLLPDPALEEEADILRLTQAFTSVLEGWIRQRPEQWAWIHDRWHHQPGKKVKIRAIRTRTDQTR